MRKIDDSSKTRVQRRVQLARGGEVAAERLLDDHARAARAARAREPFDHGREQARRDREVVSGVRRVAELLAQRDEGRRVLVVAVHVDAAATRSVANAASSMPPPCRSTLSRARARSSSSVQRDRATPMTGTSRCPRRAIAWSAGKIFLKARSPVAPKTTSASDARIARQLAACSSRFST